METYKKIEGPPINAHTHINGTKRYFNAMDSNSQGLIKKQIDELLKSMAKRSRKRNLPKKYHLLRTRDMIQRQMI